MAFWMTTAGSYYEGDQADPADAAVPQRPGAGYAWTDGAWVETPAATSRAAYEAAIAAGIALTSTGTPALSGTYAIDEEAQGKIAAVADYIKDNARFPDELVELPWLDLAGAPHLFVTTDSFMAFATAVGDLVTGLDEALGAASATMPPNAATIQ